MKRIFTITACLAALLADGAYAQTTKTEEDKRWAHMGNMSDGVKVYVDLETIRRDDDTVIVWEKYLEPDGARFMFRTQIRPDGRYRNLSVVKFSADGCVVKSWDSLPLTWTEPVPGSVQEEINKWFDFFWTTTAPKKPSTVRQ